MELFELKYFVAVAKDENIHQAAKQTRISPASLSKAIDRLENELGVTLFSRIGRNIKLTDHGRLLKLRANHILQLEETARFEVGGHQGTLPVTLVGPEILLAKFGIEFSTHLRSKYPNCNITFHASNEDVAIKEVFNGDAHLAIVTQDIPPQFTEKFLGKADFKAVVGKGHPLYSKAQAKLPIEIGELLTYPFVSPSHPFLGQVGSKQSLDGWRDDIFPRKVEYLSSSLKLMELLVQTGKAVAYLPDYFVETLGVQVLKVTGCSYSCVQTVRLVAKRAKDVGWINQIF